MKLRTIIATATTAAVLATGGVALAGASDNSTPAPPPTPTSHALSAAAPAARGDGFIARAGGRRLRIRRLLRGAGDVVTKAIDIDRATLRQELGAGRTIAEIATANHVDPQAVIDALVSAARSKLDDAVKAGKIGADRVATIEARLPGRVTKLVNNWHPKRLT